MVFPRLTLHFGVKHDCSHSNRNNLFSERLAVSHRVCGVPDLYDLSLIHISTAHAKVLNATSNVGGLLLFIIGGKVIWATGFVMMAGQFLGARAGSRLVLSLIHIFRHP